MSQIAPAPGQLLTTKLHVPSLRPKSVPRPRLVDQLNAGLHRKLTLLSAPAGFGKSTLLGEWARHCERPVAWVSLDGDDNDPMRFWSYVIGALQTIHADVGQAAWTVLQATRAAGATGLPAVRPFLAGLMNEIARLGQPFALVLDDAHVVTNSQIHEDLVFLVDYLPPQMRLVVSSRADPPWPLARLRAGSDLSELRAGSLRFTREETAAFLRAAELHLTAEDVARLEQRTEGWIAGLKMAAFSMRGRQDVSGFIRTLSGTHRFILDYLVEEVLDLQPDSVWTFLLKSSILERMTASLCDAVTERTDGRAILARLEQDNLFLVPLDDERCWYRYHHLFADLLRSRLQQAHPDKVTALHRRASRWYEQEGLVAEAISHAVEAGDPEWLANLVEENALTMMGHGQLSTVVGWLDAVPEGMVRSRPWLSVARAWALLYTGQMNAVAPVLHKARQSAQHLEDRSRRAHVEGHIAAIQAEAAYVRGEMQSTKALSRKALASLPADDRAARSFAAAHLAYALYWDGDLAAADEALADAHRLARAAGETYVAVTILCDRATVQLDRGQLRQVKGTIERALRFSDEYSGRGGQQPPSSGHAHTYMARVLYEWNDLARALWHARAGNELCRLWQQPETLATSNYTLARVLLASGDLGGALDLMAEAGRLATDLSPWIVERIASWEARIRLAGGDLAAADRWRRESGLRSDDEPALRRRFLYRTLARVLVTLGREQSDGPFLDQASGLLSRLSEAAQAAGATGSEIEFLILRAMALQAKGEIDQASTAFGRALHLAEPEGYVRIFLDEGEPVGRLLRRAAGRGIASPYVGKLLAALEGELGTERPAATPADGALVEPLTERELEVLHLLTTHLSSTEIAHELYISPNTVRSHIKNIYGKLGAHSRNDAVQRARDVGLL